jgi:hypothetical protein
VNSTSYAAGGSLPGGRTTNAGQVSSWFPERERYPGPQVWGLGLGADDLLTLKYVYKPQTKLNRRKQINRLREYKSLQLSTWRVNIYKNIPANY